MRIITNVKPRRFKKYKRTLESIIGNGLNVSYLVDIVNYQLEVQNKYRKEGYIIVNFCKEYNININEAHEKLKIKNINIFPEINSFEQRIEATIIIKQEK